MTLIAITGLALLVSGCIDSTNQSPVIETSSEVRQFSNESLPDRITMTYWSKEDMARISTPSNGRMQLRVYKCSDVEVYKDLGFISGEISIDFDWETLAEGWWEVTGWKLLVNGKSVVDEGIPVFEYRSSAGHITKNVTVNGNVQLVYRIYRSSYCANGDHYNTSMWVDNVVVGKAGNFSDNFDDNDINDESKKPLGNADVTVTAD